MSIHKALLGHGIFTEFSVANAIDRYGSYRSERVSGRPAEDSIDRFVQVLTEMQISSVWIQLFSRSGDCETRPTRIKMRKDLISTLQKAGIQWAGWGYCAGANR